MKRQKQQVYVFLKHLIIWLMLIHVFLPLTAASSHDDAFLLSRQADQEHNLIQESHPLLPEWDAPLDPDFNHNAPVVFDHSTRTAEVHRPYPACKTCIADATDYQKPYETPNLTLSSDTGTDMTTSEVTQNPEKWPNAPTVRIVAVWPSGNTSACSGMLVEKAHILTAAHCTFTHSLDLCLGEESCWVEDLQIYSNTNPEAGQPASFIKILTWTSWTENRNFDDDLAAVSLSIPFGEEIGWLGFGYHNDPLNTFFPVANFEHTSYPTESPYNGEMMTTWIGQFTTVLEHQLYSADQCQEGQSGAPSRSPDANLVIYSVLSHTLKINDESHTGHTRITSDKFFAIRDWINGGFKNLPLQHYLPLITQ